MGHLQELDDTLGDGLAIGIVERRELIDDLGDGRLAVAILQDGAASFIQLDDTLGVRSTCASWDSSQRKRKVGLMT